MSFRSLFYTDCREGQGLDGTAGPQFQAVSPGTTPEMMAVVRRTALYEPPTDAVSTDHPPSLVHVHDSCYVTARGVRSGSGGNAGGFTHALVTTDPRHYGSVRPAQLWGASWWSEGPADGTECAAVPAGPEPGPLRAEALREWVRDRPDGASWLVAVHSAVERLTEPDAPRVLFVGADADEVVRWIAAATLLLPQEHALRVGFRVFANSPEHSRHQVLALHPDRAGRLADPEQASDFAVFNLATGQRTEVEPRASALHWVPRFLAAEPSAVVEAVELAHRFAGGRLAGEGDRLAAGSLLLDEEVTAESALPLAEWIASRPPASTVEEREAVLDAVLAANPGVAALSRLAEASTGGRVRLALLRAETGAIVRGDRHEVRGPLPEPTWTPDEAEQAVAVVAAAVREVPPERMDALLRTAARFGVEPRPDADAERRFASWWVEHPDAPAEPESWPGRDRLLAALRDELARRLEGPAGPHVREAVRRHWWPLLVPLLADPFELVDALVAGAAVQAGGEPRRAAIAAFRDRLRAAERAGCGDATWDALFDRARPETSEIADFFAAIPSTDVSESLAQKAIEALPRSTVSGEYLDVLRKLVHHLGQHESARALWKEDGDLRSWLSGFRRAPEAAVASDLAGISEPVLDARAPQVLSALLEADPGIAAAVVVDGGQTLQQMLARVLPELWDDEERPEHWRDRAVALAFATAWSDGCPDAVRAALDKALERWARGHHQDDHRRVSRVLRRVDADRREAWHDWLRELPREKPKAERVRGAARWLFGRRDDR